MFGMYDISSLNLTVSHPNGTLAKIIAIGNLRLIANVELFDVLVVPEYCVSLLYVHKLIKESKFFVGFDEHKCYIHNLNMVKNVGIGSESGGLYLFDVDQNGYRTCFFESDGGGVNEKQHGSADVYMVSSAVDEPSTTALIVCKYELWFPFGKAVAYPIVENYVRNTWSKYGMVKSMLNSGYLSSILALRMVKLHVVPMMKFSKDGLSDIATKLGTPLILLSYTSDMCMQSWGWLSYARAMIELRADVKLNDTIMVVMPKLIGEGFYMYSIRVENNASSSDKNKQVAIASKESAEKGPNSEVFPSEHGSFNVASISTSTTPIVERIDKIRRQSIGWKHTLMDDDEKPLPKVISTENVDSDSEWKMWSMIVQFL
nr:ribonuclease H-like domain-containing protein [Tanacetum cinerariifolium]